MGEQDDFHQWKGVFLEFFRQNLLFWKYLGVWYIHMYILKPESIHFGEWSILKLMIFCGVKTRFVWMSSIPWEAYNMG